MSLVDLLGQSLGIKPPEDPLTNAVDQLMRRYELMKVADTGMDWLMGPHDKGYEHKLDIALKEKQLGIPIHDQDLIEDRKEEDPFPRRATTALGVKIAGIIPGAGDTVKGLSAGDLLSKFVGGSEHVGPGASFISKLLRRRA